MGGGGEFHTSPIVETIIGCAIEVHRNLGPGLLESSYSPALTYEWHHAGLDFQREVAVPVAYKGLHLSCGYRVDFVVAGLIIVETKSMEKLLPIHMAQMLTYLKLLKLKQGLLINFNVPVLKDGIRSILNQRLNLASRVTTLSRCIDSEELFFL